MKSAAIWEKYGPESKGWVCQVAGKVRTQCFRAFGAFVCQSLGSLWVRAGNKQKISGKIGHRSKVIIGIVARRGMAGIWIDSKNLKG
jgi:hypothetical protein